MKRTVLILISILCAYVCPFAQMIDINIDSNNFPDDAFRNLVLSEFDTNHDGILSAVEAANPTLNAAGKGIKSIQGIEYLDNLSYVDLSSNEITSLKGINPEKIQILRCANNRLTTIDISPNTEMRYIRELDCSNNSLTDLSLGAARNLTELNCSGNNLTELSGLEICKNLTKLDCSNNSLTDLSHGPARNLTELNCSGNNLTELSGLVICQNFSVLDCSFNLLKKLSLDMNKLEKLICNNNLLVALDFNNASPEIDGIIEPNYRTVSLSDDNKLDLSIFSDEDLDVIRMKDIAGGTLDGNTLTFNQESVSYKYQTVNDIENAGFSDRFRYMEVTLQADNF